jgi:hypothetical protein
MLILISLVLALAPESAVHDRRAPTGSEQGTSSQVRQSRVELCEGVHVTSPQQERKRRAFSASEARDLRITTTFPKELQGPHRLQLRVLTPQGHLYQKFSVPFDATVASEDRGPSPKRTIGVRLPVAGTAITTNGLYGRWSVVPYLDDGTVPCAREQQFVVEP